MSAAVACFALLTRYGFQLPHGLGLSVWTGLAASTDRRCTWVMRRLQRYTGKPEGYGAWLCRTLPAKSLVEAVEVLQSEGRLSRQDASLVEERIFALMRNGTWA